MKLKELRDSGILWAINKIVFHPLGLSFVLEFCDKEKGMGADPTGFHIRGDAKTVQECIFSSGEETVGSEKFNKFIEKIKGSEFKISWQCKHCGHIEQGIAISDGCSGCGKWGKENFQRLNGAGTEDLNLIGKARF